MCYNSIINEEGGKYGVKADYRKRLRRKKAFRMLALSYVALIAVSMVFAFINYSTLLNTVRQSAVEQTVAYLAQAAQNVNAYVDSIENSMVNLATNEDILAYVYRSSLEGGRDYWRMFKAQQEIADACVQNTNIYEMCIYTPALDHIIYSDSGRPADDFYDAFLQFENDTAEAWKDRITQSKYLLVLPAKYSRAADRNLIQFIMPVPVTTKYGTLIGIMDTGVIERAFTTGNQLRGGALLIEKDGETLFEIGTYKEEGINTTAAEWRNVDGDNYLFAANTEEGGWTYRLMVSESVFMGEFSATRMYIVRMLLLEMAGGIILSLTMIYVNYSPLRRVLKQIGHFAASGDEKGEYDRILDMTGDIIEKNKSLSGKLNEQMPLLRKSLLVQLITTDTGLDKEMLEEYGISVSDRYYAVAVLHVDGGREQRTLIMYSVMSMIESRFAGRMKLYCMETAMDRIALFMNPSSGDVSGLLADIYCFLTNEMSVDSVIGCGCIKETLSDVNAAYREAMEALAYALAWQEKGVIYYDEMVNFSKEGVFSAEDEQALTIALREGSAETAHRLVKEVFENADSDSRAHTEIKTYGIVTACLRLLCEWKVTAVSVDECIERITEHISLKNSCSALYEETLRLIDGILTIADGMKTTNTSNIGEEAMKIIEANYADKDFSLSGAAQALELSPAYLSHVFKQQTGDSFINTLNRVRMEHACKCLMDKELSVSMVAGMCGYTDAGYFTRVFKKKFGVTPGQWRDGQTDGA